MLAALLLAVAAQPDPSLTVVPWNGRKGAVSLTFDDGDASHLDIGIPELDRRGLKGTFYVITSRLRRPDEWKKAADAGHEIASHTATHRNGQDLKTAEEIEAEIDGAARALRERLGRPSYSFAYPYSVVAPAVKERVKRVHLLARAGYGKFYLSPSDEPDWHALPSQVTRSALPPETYVGWVDEAARTGTWTILMLHGLGETSRGWEPITREAYTRLLDRLKSADLWTAPLTDVAAYWKAQKLLDGRSPEKAEGAWRWTWTLPEGFPPGVVVRVRVAKGACVQKGAPLEPGPDGLLPVRMDAGELLLR